MTAAVATAGLGASATAATPNSSAGTSSSETGNLLVLAHSGEGATARAEVKHALAVTGAKLAGRQVRQIGLITVRPPAAVGLSAFAATLRRLPGVASVRAERRLVPRALPNDPALTTPDPDSGVVQWTLARESFPAAWALSQGNGALVGVIDTGVDGSQPDVAGKIAAAVDQENPASNPRSDQVGHGTHVASLACAGTNNGIGLAGAGYNCRLVIEKTDFTDSSVDAAIIDATNRHVQAINMSFGPDDPSTAGPPPADEVQALRYAAAHGVVLVAAADDSPVIEQGDPANVLQPKGTGPLLGKSLGLDVTAAEYSGARAGFAGYGSEISMAAYGAFEPESTGVLGTGVGGRQSGIFGAFPGNTTELENSLSEPCRCRTTFNGDDRYAYLAGTSMAAPQVAAVAAMMRVLNPYATVPDVIKALESSAGRARGAGWNSNLGWGTLNAGGALEAVRRVDHLKPSSRVSAPRHSSTRTLKVSWTGTDPHPGLLIASGIAGYQVEVQALHHNARLLARRTTVRSLRITGAAGATYTFKVWAIDRAGNRQAKPATATTTISRGAS